MVRKMYRFRALTYSRVEPVRPMWGEGLLEGGKALDSEEDVEVQSTHLQPRRTSTPRVG